ncbi:hypothetical protein [Varibaculum cambriense]|uniref:hypothetical protein n=1 Tax=Varibaculum cambriense TaxID=184870 RepID=UPI00241CD8D0|nr:hypothetical protein [Varibaculum cambriense]MBS5944936.1 hypothetical protein [Varibaculum cambriense]
MVNATVEKELRALHSRDGVLTCEAVVREARAKSSPLHDYFTWDDSRAAERYRLIEAGRLIATVRIEYTPKKAAQVVYAPAFIPTGTNSEGKREYFPVEEVTRNDFLREKALADARSEMEGTRARYSHLVDLLELSTEVFAA